MTAVGAQKSLGRETSFKPKADEQNIARLCRRFGISRKSLYKWKRRRRTYRRLLRALEAIKAKQEWGKLPNEKLDRQAR